MKLNECWSSCDGSEWMRPSLFKNSTSLMFLFLVIFSLPLLSGLAALAGLVSSSLKTGRPVTVNNCNRYQCAVIEELYWKAPKIWSSLFVNLTRKRLAIIQNNLPPLKNIQSFSLSTVIKPPFRMINQFRRLILFASSLRLPNPTHLPIVPCHPCARPTRPTRVPSPFD